MINGRNTIMDIFAELHTLDAVVDTINTLNNGGVIMYFGGYYMGEAEDLAAQYILRDSEEFIAQLGTDYIESELEFLAENGAQFDYEKAYNKALKLAIENGYIEQISV